MRVSAAAHGHASPRPAHVDDLRLAVIGAGLMGHSIAGVFASVGAKVRLFDSHAPSLRSAPARVAEQLARRGLDRAPAESIVLSGSLRDAVAEADLVIEAVPENLELKQGLFAEIERLAPHAILATNSSVLRIGDIAARVSDRGRVLGTHWFNPPHLVPIVEVIQGHDSEFAYIAWVIDMLDQAGKTPVHVRRDVPGFIGNRLQHALWREAIHLIETGVCDAETVDLVARQSFGLRLPAMGPMENADYVGLDLVLAVHESLFPSLCRDTEPSPVLREMVARKHLGAKTGSGFSEWHAGRREEATARLDRHLLAELSWQGETENR